MYIYRINKLENLKPHKKINNKLMLLDVFTVPELTVTYSLLL